MEGFFTPKATERYIAVMHCVTATLKGHVLLEMEAVKMLAQYVLYDAEEHKLHTAKSLLVAEYAFEERFMEPMNRSILDISLLEQVKAGRIDIAEFLLTKGAMVHSTTLQMAVKQGSTALVTLLMDHNTIYSNLALTMAAEYGQMEIALLLLDRYEAQFEDEMEGDALSYAVCGGHVEMTQFLINRGADVTANHNIALYSSVVKSSYELTSMLLEAGADPDMRDGFALTTAVKRADIPLIKLLLDHGADPYYAFEDILMSGNELILLLVSEYV